MSLNFKKISAAVAISCSLLASGIASAEPRTVATQITSMRPYTNGDYFVTVADRTLANSAGSITSCTSSTFKVNSTDAGSKTVIASLLTAYATGNDVQIEFPSSETTCVFGTNIQSVFLL